MRLSASNLTAERGDRIIFANLSFALEAGECLTVTGPNGAGKSTLLRVLAGLLPRLGGEISLTPATDVTIAEQVHYVGHADALKGLLTASENLQFLGPMLDAGHGGLTADAALAEFGLSHIANLPAAYLSAGQKRRVTLARLLAIKRPLWLLDEPLTALDAASQALMARLMTSHLAQGGLIVAATHARLGLPGRDLRLGSLS
ncbi:heme ABC exporter ATP-binding protein CcmA [Methylocapsa sp. D3K7]|uniref:heme ABC exporter ATP-binding protein CcmA n=1 Tax=Methylocapsa sp. D3K7 TaxID=3041435 RepID=UPI00244EE670|nr:heme ABC exporter ATP-binding protein CcmA [Methylocapsa sp. D3K7]WGJ13790.1 heme ABC exporter ATP-binding protein CcmA [Methylocapsa sp. D3K7]